jgi:hypothetical protein
MKATNENMFMGLICGWYKFNGRFLLWLPRMYSHVRVDWRSLWSENRKSRQREFRLTGEIGRFYLSTTVNFPVG